jgi:hypothetical protein
MRWLGQIRPPRHRRDEAWSARLLQTFFASCVGANIPALAELPLSVCGCRKFQLNPLGDHHTVKTQQVARSRGQRCGDIELAGYLANAAGPVPLVLDLRITHERFGRSSDLSIDGHLHYPNDVDRSLNEAAADNIRKYCADYNNNPPNAISFIPAIASTSGRLHSDFAPSIFTSSLGNWPLFCSFRSSACAT